MRFLAVVLSHILLVACASGPGFPLEKRYQDLSPMEVGQSERNYVDTSVVWGGVILESENLADSTRLVMLAYPLDRYQAPRLNQEALGRFVVVISGYLETADYAPDRRLTMTGKVQSVELGKVGAAEYRYPIVSASEHHLWPQGKAFSSEPAVRFGIGINISN